MLENLNSKIESSLWNAYSDSRFRFEGRWEQSSYAVITAWNPHSKLEKEDRNRINNQKLRDAIIACTWCKVTVGNPDFSWFEQSFAIVVDKVKAIELGRLFHQNAIYFVDNDELYLISCVDNDVSAHLGNIGEYTVLGGNNERYYP